jgi:ABC-type transport system involved in multi-copper enzyme maturation permease subunit
MTAGLLSPPIVKEVRALAPIWAGAIAVSAWAWLGVNVTEANRSAIGSSFFTYLFVAAGLVGSAFGAIGLGAMAFGHEHTYGTVTFLLSQPIDRRRLLLNKLSVLVAMVGTLIAVTAALFWPMLRGGPSPHTSLGFAVVAAVSSLSLAPWLTLLCRSPLAGAVFAVGIPGLTATLSDLLAGAISGLDRPAALDRLSTQIFWSAMALLCTVAAAGVWRGFLRLEVLDGSQGAIQLPGASLGRVTATRRRTVSATRALVAKELRLQQLIFVVAAVFTAVWIGIAVRELFVAGPPEFPFLPVASFYAMMLALLSGSLTSAQERELGTLEGQTLQPVAGWRQWLAKVGVAWTLVLTLGVALPLALTFVLGTGSRLRLAQAGEAAGGVLVLAAVGTYLSSVCRTSMTAFVCSVPSVVALILYLRLIIDNVDIPGLRGRQAAQGTQEGLALVAIAGFIALLVWLAFRNHRRAGGAMERLLRQIPAIAVYIAASAIALSLLA